MFIHQYEAWNGSLISDQDTRQNNGRPIAYSYVDIWTNNGKILETEKQCGSRVDEKFENSSAVLRQFAWLARSVNPS